MIDSVQDINLATSLLCWHIPKSRGQIEPKKKSVSQDVVNNQIVLLYSSKSSRLRENTPRKKKSGEIIVFT
jgi:hypothetical protein